MGKRKEKKKAEMFKPIFPLEKILTISAEDYVGMEGTEKRDYIPVGVHYQNKELNEFGKNIIKEFRRLIPENAEIVVKYIPFTGGAGSHCNFMLIGASGTALVPRPKQEEED